ncbi:hypothetical protein OG581_52355 [Streptomyces sp. NBC_01386]|uniref:WD40 repeat domain-containing protein n=1 Tax=Streptomyces sp. NBC_01386 TaxID=2903848 RepID=UPI00324B3AB4
MAVVAIVPPGHFTRLYVFRADTGAERFTRDFDNGFRDVSWSPDGRRLAAGDTTGGVTVMNPLTGAAEFHLGAGDSVFDISWNADGRFLATFSAAAFDGEKPNNIRVYDLDAVQPD